jgi:lipopolysaccharide transport system ATP-binding protein
MTVLLEVNDLWKKYSRDLKSSVKYAARDILRSAVNVGKPDDKQLRDSEFWAIRNMNFTLRRGEVLAVLGHNGAGKSTLLKCIAGKLAADRGRVIRRGELGYLLEMSAGFSPTMTGRDNVAVRGRLMGLTGKSLASYIAEVKEFSELEEFFDSPVQFYSSGMKSRLGFAASSVMSPDILIIDEVLAVGDLSFRLRCYERVNELARNAAVIFVSHSIGQVARLCNRGIYLEKGKVLYEGGVQSAIALYQDKLGEQNEKRRGHVFHPERISFKLLVNGVDFVPGAPLPYGANLGLDVDISQLPRNAVIRPMLRDGSGGVLLDWNSVRSELLWPEDMKRLSADLGKLELAPGAYSLSIEVMSPDGVEHISLSESTPFRVGGAYLNAIAIQKTAQWRFAD